MELTAGGGVDIRHPPTVAVVGRGQQAEKEVEGQRFLPRLETLRGVGGAGATAEAEAVTAAAAARARQGRRPHWQEARGQQAQARACPKGMAAGPAETTERGAQAEAARGVVVGPGAVAVAVAGEIEVPRREGAEGGAETTTTAAASTEIGSSAAEERTVSAGVMGPAVETAGGQMKKISKQLEAAATRGARRARDFDSASSGNSSSIAAGSKHASLYLYISSCDKYTYPSVDGFSSIKWFVVNGLCFGGCTHGPVVFAEALKGVMMV